jgi:4-diphosphocytidyl-2-C-methyl-D-erythritol kinase
MTATISMAAYAKINLCLDVLGRRSDGLHEVRTVMQSVSLADRLVYRLSDELRLHLRGMPAAADNLILRAAELLRAHARGPLGCVIHCEKRIPIGAGLGGGSADAAATLRALNQLWGCGLDTPSLQALAGQLGADVPFFITGGTALASGTGRDLALLPDAPPHWVALAAVEAETETKTAELYRALTPSDYGDGLRPTRMAEAIRAGSVDYASIGTSFSRPSLTRWAQSRAALALIEQAQPLAATVTGAGPSVFGLFPGRASAIAAFRTLRAQDQRAHLLQFVPGYAPSFA